MKNLLFSCVKAFFAVIKPLSPLASIHLRRSLSFVLVLLAGTGAYASAPRAHLHRPAVEAPAADHTITGKVTDANGVALPGVTIHVKGTSAGTVTDAAGKFKIEVSVENAVLVFSYLGLETKEVPVGKQTAINVILQIGTASCRESV